ncbi:adhesion G-protein coupled receptor G2 [Chanos chanos]|uniref:Adhesion G-protein coupled receptor G2 n=1 Tax=Chanos chanos TaxID=29144 RepID=A0A6J2WV36_CHACN|nr:adhesion G-protein coupled receptor G2-like [Chanos chanos]
MPESKTMENKTCRCLGYKQEEIDEAAYYWMTVRVEVTGVPQTELNVSAWLNNVFQTQLSSCPSPASLKTDCVVLLKVSQPVQACCIRDSVVKRGVTSIFRGVVVHDRVDTVAKGLCNSVNPVPSLCNSSSPLSDVCSANSTLACLQNCIVVIRLKQQVDLCAVSQALREALVNRPGITSDWKVERAAICGWTGGLTQDPFKSNLTVISVSISNSQLCEITDPSVLDLAKCKNGSGVVVLLSDSCEHDLTTTVPPTTTLNATMSITTTEPENNTMTVNSTTVHLTTAQNSTPLTANHSTTANMSTFSPHTTREPTTTTYTTPEPTTTSYTTETSTSTSTVFSTTAVPLEDQLLELSSRAASLNSSEIEELVSELEELLKGPNITVEQGQIIINIVSNLLNASADALAASSRRIIGIVDTVGLKLIVQDQSETLLADSLALAVNRVDGTQFQQLSFSITDPSNVQISGGSRRRRSTETQVPQGSITLPSSLTENLSPEEQALASRAQFNFYQTSVLFQDKALGERKVISGILGTSVANLSISGLTEDIIITLRHTEPILENYSSLCVFWDFSLNNGSGGWSSDNCTVRNSTANQTVCGCGHLTSFGILLDISREGVTSRLQSIILTYITYIGCGISAIFLSVTLLTYLAFGKLRKDIPSKILIQLCLALLMLNLVFLLDAWLALYKDAVGLCISTAFFLHYFLLASFTWMALEAVHMYLALVKVFNTYVSRYMLKFGLAGWGIPLIVVIIVIAVDKDNYGLVSYGKFSDGTTDEFCWLRSDVAFYVAVVAYFCAVFLLNLAMFVVVMVQLCRIKRQNPHNVQHRSGLQDARSVAGLTVLLGLTWGFAFFAWGPVNLAFMYLFAIFNTLQGFFIFVFHCAVKENVRKQWRAYLCCGKLRLPENSEWSRTATQKTAKKTSMFKISAYSSSNSSRSNNSSTSTTYLVSSGSDSPSNRLYNGTVNPVMQDPSPDVVQNAIISQNASRRAH